MVCSPPGSSVHGISQAIIWYFWLNSWGNLHLLITSLSPAVFLQGAVHRLLGRKPEYALGSRANLWTNELKGVGLRLRARPLTAPALLRSIGQESWGGAVDALVFGNWKVTERWKHGWRSFWIWRCVLGPAGLPDFISVLFVAFPQEQPHHPLLFRLRGLRALPLPVLRPRTSPHASWLNSWLWVFLASAKETLPWRYLRAPTGSCLATLLGSFPALTTVSVCLFLCILSDNW